MSLPNAIWLSAVTYLCLAVVIRANGDTFGTGANSFEIDFVTVGNPGNAADLTGMPSPAGSVPYVYRIGKFEISRDMILKANSEGLLGLTLANMSDFGGNGKDRPATGISWIEATRFVNWLNTSTGNPPAYKFDGAGNFLLWSEADNGFDPSNMYRNKSAMYFLPSTDEWYKAAYYEPTNGEYFSFPTGSYTAPVPVSSGTAPNTAVYDFNLGPADVYLAGGLSPYGTMAQGGNVYELEETDTDLLNDGTAGNGQDFRGFRGGHFYSNDERLSKTLRAGNATPTTEGEYLGFRVASVAVPEPSAAVTMICVSTYISHMRRRESRRHRTRDCRGRT